MTALHISPATVADTEALVDLWTRCGLTRPWNDPRADIALALRTPTSTILTGRVDGTLVASAMVGHDGHRGWVYYVAIAPDYRHRAFGRQIMQAAEEFLRKDGVPKLQLMVRSGNKTAHSFYSKLGYAPNDSTVMQKWIDGRDG